MGLVAQRKDEPLRAGSGAWLAKKMTNMDKTQIEEPRCLQLAPSHDSANRVVLTHPGKTAYHDNSLWVPIGGMKDGSGIWLMPGQAIAVVDSPNKK